MRFEYFPQTFLEPLSLIEGGDYNLNVVKESKGTESFYGLEVNVRGCQEDEPYVDCSTNIYKEKMIEKCRCLPFNIRSDANQVES